jgi:hypothetical protein
MSDFKDRMADYVPVNERIEAFYTAWPQGTLQSEIVELTPDRVTVKAYAYRAADDEKPGIGHSSLEIPGSTPYTRGSEIENAETSAWGRAIAALGFEVKRGLASAEEVRNKQPQGDERAPTPGRRGALRPAVRPAAQRSAEEQALIGRLLEIPGMTVARMSLLADAVGIPKGSQATADQLREMLRRAEQPGAGVPPRPAEPDTPDSDGPPSPQDGSDPATPEAGDPPSTSPPAAQPTFEDVLRVSGGVDVTPPPKKGTPEYGALTAPQKAAARAWWQARGES